MSEETQAPVIAEKPQSIIDLEQTLNNIHSNMETVKVGTFPGGKATSVVALMEFLKGLFQQVLTQYNSDPWVVEMKAQIEKAQAAELAKAQAVPSEGLKVVDSADSSNG